MHTVQPTYKARGIGLAVFIAECQAVEQLVRELPTNISSLSLWSEREETEPDRKLQ